MRIKKYEDIDEFLLDSEEILLRDKVKFNYILSSLFRVKQNPTRFPLRHFWTVFDAEKPAGFVWQVMPVMLNLEGSPENCLPEIFDCLLKGGTTAFSVLRGMVEPVEHAAIIWKEKMGATPVNKKFMRSFELLEVHFPMVCDGLMRLATRDDEAIVAAWEHEFKLSTRTNITNENEAKEREISITNSKLAIARASRFLWCVNGKPCCVANVEGDSSFGSRIAGVYTPPELRGRGYASNLVAHASQHMLNQNKGPCCLNTDLSNPTSNSIYQRIGYRPVCDEAAYFYE
jgi:hypothetical protein